MPHLGQVGADLATADEAEAFGGAVDKLDEAADGIGADGFKQGRLNGEGLAVAGLAEDGGAVLSGGIDEAAALVGNVSPRSWQYWERGERPIPADVATAILELIAWRQQAIAAADGRFAELQAKYGTAALMALVWYQSPIDWPGEPSHWRPHCSVVAELAARHGAMLVPFDGPTFSAWLGDRADSEAMRSQWAAVTALQTG